MAAETGFDFGPAPHGPPALAARVRHWLAQRRRPITAAFSLAAHGLIVLALFNVQAEPPPPLPPEPMIVQMVAPRLVEPPKPPTPEPTPDPEPAPSPAPAAAAPAPPTPTPPKPVPPKPRKTAFRPTPTPVTVKPLPAGEAPAADAGVEVSAAQLAGAATAGSGPAGGNGTGRGGSCDMLRWLQSQLRKDARVQAAVAQAHNGKPLMVWNGDWIRHSGQEGGGLAAVREAMMWEIAFAPEACRAQPVRGLIVISLNDGPGSPRLVAGDGGQWRWSDMLFAEGRGPSKR